MIPWRRCGTNSGCPWAVARTPRRTSEVATGPGLRKEIVRRFKLVAPCVEYVNQILLSELREEEGKGESIPKRPKPMF